MHWHCDEYAQERAAFTQHVSQHDANQPWHALLRNSHQHVGSVRPAILLLGHTSCKVENGFTA